jgi:hypothetical protein
MLRSAATKRFGGKLNFDTLTAFQLAMKRIQSVSTLYYESKMMKSDDILSVEGNRFRRVFGLPQSDHQGSVADEHCRIVRLLSDFRISECIQKKCCGGVKIRNGQPDVVCAVRKSCHLRDSSCRLQELTAQPGAVHRLQPR